VLFKDRPAHHHAVVDREDASLLEVALALGGKLDATLVI
jgi:hypothetical protein